MRAYGRAAREAGDRDGGAMSSIDSGSGCACWSTSSVAGPGHDDASTTARGKVARVGPPGPTCADLYRVRRCDDRLPSAVGRRRHSLGHHSRQQAGGLTGGRAWPQRLVHTAPSPGRRIRPGSAERPDYPGRPGQVILWRLREPRPPVSARGGSDHPQWTRRASEGSSAMSPCRTATDAWAGGCM